MAKKPTIRLKKTELPIDSHTAYSQAEIHQDLFVEHTRKLLAEFHTGDGGELLESSPRFRTDFNAMAFHFKLRAPLKLHPQFELYTSRRLLDGGSQLAPWIWSAKRDLSGPRIFVSKTANVETIVTQEETPFSFQIPFPGLVLDEPADDETRLKMYSDFLTSRPMRALQRYIARINWECIKSAVPAFFQVNHIESANQRWTQPGWDGDRIFCPAVAIRVGFSRTWLSSSEYKARSLLTGEGSLIPAEYDFERAKAGFLGDAEVVYIRIPLDMTTAFQILSSYSRVKTPNAGWAEELLFGKDPTPADVRSGKALIPPKAEIVAVTSLLEKVPEMKRIIRTLLRIARPYDHASFLPTSL